MKLADRLQVWPVARLQPYERNARTHSPEQVAKIAASISEFGFNNPILVDSADGIIAGHGRLMAAKKLKLDEVPVIILDHLSDAQRRAYILADNRMALDAGWNEDLLAEEMLALQDEGFDLGLTGFNDKEIDGLLSGEGLGEGEGEGGEPEEGHYTKKVEAPIYTPKGDKPEISMLADPTKSAELVARIMDAKVTEEERLFLLAAAARHVVFNYHQIAEYYCHATKEMQSLMEDSALVIIDFGKAVEHGYVELSNRLSGIYSESYGDDDDDGE